MFTTLKIVRSKPKFEQIGNTGIVKELLGLSATDVQVLTRWALLVMLRRAATKVTTWGCVQEPSSPPRFQWTQQKNQLLPQVIKSEKIVTASDPELWP